MGGKLSAYDARIIDLARASHINDEEERKKVQVLKDVDQFKADLKNGAIVVACSDGDQGEDLKGHIHQMIREQCGCAREHGVSVNGGVLVVSPHSPLNNLAKFFPSFVRANVRNPILKFLIWLLAPFLWVAAYFCLRQDWVMIINIWVAVGLKGIKTVALYVHAPCGAASACGMTVCDQFRHLIAAKRRLKRMLAFAGVKFPCFVHVDYGPNGDGLHKKRTYFTKTHELESWLDTLPAE